MSHITVEAPESITRKFSGQRVVSFEDMYKSIVDDYEAGFEYEEVNMEAWAFRKFLVKELNYD